MPYIEGRKVHDADSHIFESPDFYLEFAEPEVREKMEFLYGDSDGFGDENATAASPRTKRLRPLRTTWIIGRRTPTRS